MKPRRAGARHSDVELKWRPRTALAILLSLKAWTACPFCQTISGNVTVSAGTASTTSYLSIAREGLGSLSASLPLSARKDFLAKLSVTAATAIGSAEIDAGKLRLKAWGYFSSNDRGASEGAGLLSAAALGASSDPWGIALHAPRFSCAATISELYSSAALQWRASEAPIDLILGAGALCEMSGFAEVAGRIRPWCALGLRRAWGSGEARVRAQLYPELGRDTESGSMRAIRGAAARADLKFQLGNIDVRADTYIETGEFLSACGAVSTYDAAIGAAFRLDLSMLPLVNGAALTASAKSAQGPHGSSTDEYPSYGAFANPLVSRYWPDTGAAEISLLGKREAFALIGRELYGSLACGAALRYEFGNTSLSLNARAMVLARDRPGRALSFETKLTGEKWDATGDSESSYSFSDIEELELGGESLSTEANHAPRPLFQSLDFLVRGSGPRFSLSGSMSVSLPGTSGDGISGRLRASFKLPQCSLEASCSMRYAGSPRPFSISSARLYMRIPF